MNPQQIRKLKKRLAKLRAKRANIRNRELVSFAKFLGRVPFFKRGKEPVYINEILPDRAPISIPNHPGALKKFTVNNILDEFEVDISYLEEMFKN